MCSRATTGTGHRQQTSSLLATRVLDQLVPAKHAGHRCDNAMRNLRTNPDHQEAVNQTGMGAIYVVIHTNN
jgi:hypothetical protein